VAAVLSSYSFLARSLLRTGYAAQGESASRKTLYTFESDVGLASAINTATANDVILTTGGNSVEYSYDSTAAVLKRRVNSGAWSTYLSGLNSCSFSFFDSTQTAVSSTATIKFVSIAYTTVAGSTVSGTRASLPVQSARVLIRNKPYLQ
jgi:hypothetical protein